MLAPLYLLPPLFSFRLGPPAAEKVLARVGVVGYLDDGCRSPLQEQYRKAGVYHRVQVGASNCPLVVWHGVVLAPELFRPRAVAPLLAQIIGAVVNALLSTVLGQFLPGTVV